LEGVRQKEREVRAREILKEKWENENMRRVLSSGIQCCVVMCFLLHVGFLIGYSSTLKMKVIYSSETSADLHYTTWYYILKDRNLHSQN
jgi:hypothetical protein